MTFGLAFFRKREDVLLLLRTMQWGILTYIPFVLIELKLSPQMHNWVYGFAQHDFGQTVRGDGYRPMVFMSHGLGLTLFMAATVVASVLLHRAKMSAIRRVPSAVFAGVVFFVLIICKSVGATVFAAVYSLLMFVSPKMQMRVMGILFLIVIGYPISRATEVFPAQQIVETVTSMVGAERAQSLSFRFDNEQLLADHASRKPLFGWGRFQRNMLFGPWSDEATSVSDGFWIVLYGVRGGIVFVVFFVVGLLLPLLALRRAFRVLQNRDERILASGIVAICYVYFTDLVLNGFFTNFPMLILGAALGFLRSATAPATSVTVQSAS
jgi:hypothetical protein